MPHPPALPEPAAVLPGEADLLAAVVAHPADDTPRLVYADWLEEHDDPARAGFLRKLVAAVRSGGRLPATGRMPKPWLGLVGATLAAGARKHGFGAEVGTLLRLARPGFSAEPRRTPDARLPVGASKFGGAPDLPDEVDWPADDDDRPLAFLAQYNLADLAGGVAARDLPPAGLLSVFYDAVGDLEDDDIGDDGWRLLYHPAPAALARREVPAEVGREGRFRSCRLTFAERLMVPDASSAWAADLGSGDDIDYDRALGLTMATGAHDVFHRVLGYAQPIQNEVEGKKTVRHLLSIDSDDQPGWMWGDSGTLYFTIADKDLKAGRFDRVRCEMQCS